MTHDRPITISTGESRRATQWTPMTLLWSQLAARLRAPLRSAETLEEYLAMPQSRQAELKDRGGFVGGTLRDGRRKADGVLQRDVLALDLDSIPPDGTQAVLDRVDGLGTAYIVYSTRKHRPEAPRLRVLILLDKPCTADQYEPLARLCAQRAGVLEWADPTTFEASRLMYWPTACAGAPYVYAVGDRAMLERDAALAGYADWRDVNAWPRMPGEERKPARTAARQGDPGDKPGIVGAFCRAYDVYRAMGELLCGAYEPTDVPCRYTFTGGTTAGGAVIYDGGRFLYSHHATDPCCGRLVNSYDFVRRHRFGHLDAAARPGTPPHRLPSAAAMNAFARGLPDVMVQMVAAATVGMSPPQDIPPPPDEACPLPPPPDTSAQDWIGLLAINPQTGAILKTVNNIVLVLEHDPRYKDRLVLDEFSQRKLVVGDLPWKRASKVAGTSIAAEQRRSSPMAMTGNAQAHFLRQFTDYDDAQLIRALEHEYGLGGADKVHTALYATLDGHRINVVTDWFDRLHWDGGPRLERLFIDYLGAEDCPYVRQVTRKSFCAAVARAYRPGIKYDYVPTLLGGQGIGKSTLLATMGGQWFCDSLEVFEGKEAAEMIQGKLLVELGELRALSRSDEAAAKHFLSKRDDQYRAPYEREVAIYPRRCVFFGSTNVPEFLKDPTGNRRFWPIECQRQPAVKDIFCDLPSEREQLWAEAVVLWRDHHEPLYLDRDMESAATRRQSEHREDDPRLAIVAQWLLRPIPADWASRAIADRLMYWSGEYGTDREDTATAPRRTVSRQEIWVECFRQDPARFTRRDAYNIGSILEALPEWERIPVAFRNGPYGVEKGYRRRQ